MVTTRSSSVARLLRTRAALTAGLMLTTFGVALEALSVLPVAPQVAAELPDGLVLYSWVFAGFFLGAALAIPVVGPVVDRHGPVGVFVAGLAAFTAGLVIGGLAPSMGVLVVGRVIQGAGSGVISAVAFATVALAYEPSRRPRGLAQMSTSWLLPSVLGPLFGGIVAHAFGWRWVFLGLAVLMPLAALVVVPPMRALGDRLRPAPGSVPAGVWRRGPRTYLSSLVPARGGVRSGALLLFLASAVVTGTESFAALALAEVRGLDVLATGLTLAVLALAWGAGSVTQDRISGRVDAVRTARIGSVSMLLGVPVIALTVAGGVPLPVTYLGWLLLGFGAGFTIQSANLHVMDSAGTGQQGRATASAQLANTLGAALGAWALGLVLATMVDAGSSLVMALTLVFTSCTGLAIGGLFVARRLVPRGKDATSISSDPTSSDMPTA